MGKGGNTDQPFSQEAKIKLKKLIEGKTVSVKLLQRDQYGRAVCVVSTPKWWIFKNDVAPILLESGLAVMYTGKDACYDGNRSSYSIKERKAKRAKRGIWAQPGFQTPADYKNAARGFPPLL